MQRRSLLTAVVAAAIAAVPTQGRAMSATVIEKDIEPLLEQRRRLLAAQTYVGAKSTGATILSANFRSDNYGQATSYFEITDISDIRELIALVLQRVEDRLKKLGVELS